MAATFNKKHLVLAKTITIPRGIVATQSAERLTRVGYYSVLIPIGDDNTAELLISKEGLMALDAMQPQTTIS